MSLRNERELQNTRRKLRLLEDEYEALRVESSENQHVREVAMKSIKRLINQFKEEIATYEALRLVKPK
jgi:hypothetical protein